MSLAMALNFLATAVKMTSCRYPAKRDVDTRVTSDTRNALGIEAPNYQFTLSK